MSNLRSVWGLGRAFGLIVLGALWGNRIEAADAPTATASLKTTVARKGKAAETRRAGVLNLSQSVDRALSENYALRINRVDADNATQSYQIARAAFDPVFRGNYERSFSRAASAESELLGALVPESEHGGFGTGIDQYLFSGGTLSLETGSNRDKTNAAFALPSYDADLRLSFNQPLLQGGGFGIARIPLQLARVGLAVSDLRLRQAILKTVAEVETAFWELGLQRLAHQAREAAVATSLSLLEEVDARITAGLANRIDRLRGETSLAREREALLISEQEMARASDELVRLLGGQNFDQLAFVGNEGFSRGTLNPFLPEAGPVLAKAQQVEPEYLIAKQGVARSELLVRQARNQVLPKLDVVASGGYSGRGGDYHGAYDGAWGTKDGQQWNFGLQLSIPWGLREGRARLQQSKNEQQSAQLSAEEAHQTLTLAVRTACRNVAAAWKQMEAARIALKLSLEQADQLKAQYAEGLVEFRDVLEAQDTVTQNTLNISRARFAAIRAEVEVARLDGSLLDRHQLSWK